jgi:exodeoxyribonuclease-5
MKFQPTNDQKNATERIIAFLEEPYNPDEYSITLSGYAGTGKTTVTEDIINHFKYKKKIVVSAPTHKAKEKIAQVTKQNAETIQALLGLRPNLELTDFNPNKPQFDVRAEERIQYYNILIIDEASMLNTVMVDLLEEKAVLNKVKIIYVGDKYQLPPVGEKISKVFLLKNVVELNEIVRQSNGNPNQYLIELARNDVRDGTDTFLSYINQNLLDMNNEEGFKVLEKEDYYSSLLEKYYDSEYQQNPDIVKTIAWTNKAVGSINAYLRKHIIESKELVAVGDILMGYKSIIKEVKYPPFFIPVVKNSVDYIVTNVEIIEQSILGVNLKGYKVTVKDGLLPMFILHRDSYNTFVYEYNDRLEKAKVYKQWKSFYNFKEQVMLIENVKDEFGNHVCDKDIDYGYAITVHKSQGSTYENVGVTLSDIKKNGTLQERRKLIYVAVSRTSKLNLLYG